MDIIPFNRPSLAGSELDYIRDAVEGGHTSASGPFTKRAAEILRAALGAQEAILTTSCTDALEMAAMLLDIGEGDTVIVPSFTFVSTALAFARQGAQIRFADIEPTTLGMCPNSVESLLDGSVRAVVPVHYAGVGCDLAGLAAVLAGRDGIDVVEDNAHGLFGAIDDRPLGSFGRFSTLSFHETKNFICGEGGALIVNRPDDVARAHVLRDKGTDRYSFLLGDVDKYTWQDTGSSFGMSDVLAAYLFGQLEQREAILAKRRALFERYERLLAPHAERLGFRLPVVPPGSSSAYHMFYVLMADVKVRDRVLAGMHEVGVRATFHYVPLHSSPGGQRFSDVVSPCPVTDDVSSRLLRLPFFNDLSEADADRVAATFLEVAEGV